MASMKLCGRVHIDRGTRTIEFHGIGIASKSISASVNEP